MLQTFFRNFDLLSVLTTILPVFLILGLGYAVAKLNYVPVSVADGLNAYALKVGVPILLFMAMYRLDFSQAFHFQMLVGFYTGAVSCFVIGIILARFLWNRRPGESIAVGFCALFSNTLLLGVPIAHLAFGQIISAPVFGIIALHASLLYTIGMFSMEFARSDGRRLSETVQAATVSIAANPLMAGIVLGLLANFFKLPLPAFAITALDMIVATAIPVFSKFK